MANHDHDFDCLANCGFGKTGGGEEGVHQKKYGYFMVDLERKK
jgi:hypothetical protein